MFPGYNQFPKSNTPGPDGQPNQYRAQYNDPNQNMFPQFDAHRISPSSLSHLTILQASNNPKSPYFEEDNDNVQVPQHIKFLFSSNEKPTYDNPNAFNFPPGFNRIAPNSNQSPYFQPNAGQGMPFPGFNIPNYQADQQNAAQAFQSERSSSNQSGNSRTMSINDASQELSQRVDPNTSGKKNTSSKAQLRHKNSQKVVNEDINLIERIETILNQVTLNHNKVCPFCSKFINLKRSNFQNISAFQSHTTNKYYLTHFDCYLKSKTDKVDDDTVRIVPLANIVQAALQPPVENALDLKVYKKSNNKKAYFVSIEGFHPISSYLLFKLDKVCNSLEHSIHHNQLLNLDFSKKTTSFFEPKLYMLPFNDFKIVTTIQVSHSDEDPYVFEYLVDLSKISISSEQPEQTIEASYTEDNNNIKLVFQILYDTNNDLKSNMNMSMSLDVSNNNLSTSATAAGRPEFGRNVFLLIKQFTASLPLTNKIEFKGKSSASLASSEGTQRFSASNRLPNKINIIPDAPLFGNTIASPMLKPQIQPNFPQNVVQQDNYAPSPGLKNNNNNPNFKPYGMINQNANNGNNNYFNVPLFNQNMQFPQGGQRPFGDQDGTPNNDTAMPPGLINNFAFDQPFSGSASPFYQNQNNNNPNFDMNFPPHHKQSLDSTGGYGGFPERPQTPETLAQSDNDTPSNRGRIKGPVASLRTEVLMNNVRRDSSMSNSPSLNKIQRDFFSGVSTPRSDTDPNPIGGPAPLSRFPNFDSHNDQEENSATLPLTEDMIENFKLEDYKGRLAEFAKSYHGSRILQKFFPKANQQEIDFVIYEIQDKMEELMLDSYANYMFQTLAQSCSSEQRYYLLQKLAPSMIRVARDRKGTHSLQAIVSLINRDVEDKLIKQTLEGHVFELAFDAQATHLIQKLITSISLNNIGFIYEPIIQRFVEVANNSFGLCVLKQLMTKVDKVPEMKARIINLLHDNLEELIQNPYGNYAVQHALDIYPLECGKILDRIIDKIVQYSNQKFSSNVIEKCFVNTSSEYKKKFVSEIIKSDRLLELMKNKYGNYVILKILSTSETEEKRILAQSLLKNVNSINVPKYKNHWLQFLEENPMKIPGLNVQKPSIFKPAGPDPYSAGSHSEVNSPGIGGDQWGYNSQEGKRPHKDSRDEKSQFYHEKNRGPYGQRNSGMMNQQGGWEEGYDDNRGNRNYQHQQNQQNWFEVKNFKNNQNNNQNNGDGQGQGGNGNNSAKKPKNFNQKFYEKNQYYSNKGGYNNFY